MRRRRQRAETFTLSGMLTGYVDVPIPPKNYFALIFHPEPDATSFICKKKTHRDITLNERITMPPPEQITVSCAPLPSLDRNGQFWLSLIPVELQPWLKVQMKSEKPQAFKNSTSKTANALSFSCTSTNMCIYIYIYINRKIFFPCALNDYARPDRTYKSHHPAVDRMGTNRSEKQPFAFNHTLIC